MRRLETVIDFVVSTIRVIIFVLGTITAALLAVAGLIVLLAAAIYGHLVYETVSNSERLDRQFREAVVAIGSFEQSHGRRPTDEELEPLLEPQGNAMFADVGFDQCEGNSSAFANLREPDYVLAIWRGEWWECYAPTRGMSTLVMDPSRYAFSGYVVLDQLVIALVGVALLIIASYWLWGPLGPKPTPPGEA